MNKLGLAAVLAILLAGCAEKEVLSRHSAAVPAGIDLGGQWRLAGESAATNQRLLEAGAAAARVGKGRKQGSLVHVFLETGSNLKITQTRDGLFISFDRSIVEEYRFGEYTEVNVGPVVAARSSGWERGGYLIETLDDAGNKLREHYQLAEEGGLLLRHISIWQKGDLQMSLVQKFDRIGR